MKLKIPKQVHVAAVVLAGIGAVNIALSKFVNLDLLNFVPAGMVSTVIYAAVGLSGAVMLYELYDKKI
jgi:uncharacterized membrane protein YuzA (DUF378 family)